MTTVLAYLDPGSGSMILQIIAGGVAAVAVTAKLYWNKLLRFLHIKKDEPETASSEPARSPASACPSGAARSPCPRVSSLVCAAGVDPACPHELAGRPRARLLP